MQISIAQELTGVPEFRKYIDYTAYTEGWGLYAEQLGKDVGFYQDPYSDFGRLEADIWRAVRLVVDTGVHAKHWSREQMVDYFRQHSAIGETDIQAEVDRYIAWPSQALGYKVGQLKLLELRARAQQELGDRFKLAPSTTRSLIPARCPSIPWGSASTVGSRNKKPKSKQGRHSWADTQPAQSLAGLRVAILGAGKMGGILVQAFLKSKVLEPEQILATVEHEDRAGQLSAQWGVDVSTDNLAAAQAADLILFGLKPVTVPEVVRQIRPALTPQKLLIRSPPRSERPRSSMRRIWKSVWFGPCRIRPPCWAQALRRSVADALPPRSSWISPPFFSRPSGGRWWWKKSTSMR